MASHKLHNALAEMLVAVGMDRDTGLVPAQPLGPDGLSETSLFHEQYEPKPLAAITRLTANFPQSAMQFDWRYPPSVFNLHHRQHNRSDHKDIAVMRKRMSRKYSTTPLTPSRRNTGIRGSNKPQPEAVSSEMVNSLTHLCFPDGAYVFRNPQPSQEQVQYQVLTDITGVRSYATCLTIYCPYIARKASSGDCFLIEHEDPDVELEPEHTRCFVPVCLILISQYPYFTVLRDCLSTILPNIRNKSEFLTTELKELAIRVTMTPVPPAGKLAVCFDLLGSQILLHPSDYPDKPVMDIPLHCVFFCFSIDTILKIISCILTMQRVVFMSSNYALLTVISESFLAFILPFQWQFTYVPVLPEQLLELIDAPGTFILGCHSAHKEKVEQVEGIVWVDIDHGSVSACPSISSTIYDIPEEPANKFKEVCKRARLHYELDAVKSPSCLSAEEAIASQKKHRQQFHRDILSASLELMVNLFRDVMSHIQVERNYFNQNEFLQSQVEEDQPFYKEVLETDMFKNFLRERFLQKQDYWTVLEERTRPVLRRSIRMVQDKVENSRRSRKLASVRPANLATKRRSTCFALLSVESDIDLTFLVLPNYVEECRSPHYFERVRRSVTEMYEMSRSSSLRASCLYLRGMMNVALGHIDVGLEDFQSLSANDTRLFPNRLVNELIAIPKEKSGLEEISEEEPSVLEKSHQIAKMAPSRSLSNSVDIITACEVVPDRDVDFMTFEQKIQLAEIAADRDTILRLFEALTVGKVPEAGAHEVLIDKDTFQLFYECWNESEEQYRGLNPPEEMLDPNEGILKVSSLIKTDKGSGRLMLTSKRLFYIQQGSENYDEVSRLRDVTKLEKFQQTSFPKNVDAIRIYQKGNDKSPFVACLKEVRNCWYLLIQEMWCGLIIADEVKDPGIIQQAALNVLLLDAVISSGEEKEAHHSTMLEVAASGLCYFTKLHQEGSIRLPSETREILQHRINPNIREAEMSAVEVLLYMSGYNAEDRGPKLWCGLFSGKVKVYDASTWLLESEFPLAGGGVVSLLAVGESKVWAGSLDGIIYVIDSTSKACNQRLTEHNHMISHLVASQDKTLVYSASVDGVIIVWKAEELLKHSQIQLPQVNSLRTIKLFEDEIWCSVEGEIRIVSQKGELLRSLKYSNGKKVIDRLDCFMVTNQGHIWTGCNRQKEMLVWNLDTFELIKKFEVDCRGFTKMVLIGDKIWAASKGGYLYIFDHVSLTLERCLKAHDDAIRSLCCAQSQYVISGAGGKDGKIAIWRTSAMFSASASLELDHQA